MKLWGYLIGGACVLGAEIFVLLKGFFEINNDTLFVLGGIWLWRGIASFLRMDVEYHQQYTRKRQLVMGGIDFGLGLSWIVLSVTNAGRELIPIVVVSVPFILAQGLLYYYHKK